jgi:hypothetical protein
MIVPVLGRMSDSDDDVRATATNTFASLVKMVPLEVRNLSCWLPLVLTPVKAGLPDPPGFSDELMKRRDDERQFLTQLLDGKKVEVYELPVPIKAELRHYQQEGVNWLAFLAKYQLHGILCDGEEYLTLSWLMVDQAPLQTWVWVRRYSRYVSSPASIMSERNDMKRPTPPTLFIYHRLSSVLLLLPVIGTTKFSSTPKISNQLHILATPVNVASC